jgi:hypothetical protein
MMLIKDQTCKELILTFSVRELPTYRDKRTTEDCF